MRNKNLLLNDLKELKNIFNYNLNEMDIIYINESGEIVGGSNYMKSYKKGSIFSPLDNGLKLKVLEVKKILIVEKV